MNKQRGAFMIATMVVIIAIAAAYLAEHLMEANKIAGNRVAATKDNMERVRKALVAYVATHGYLPCPAQGNIPDTPDTQPLSSNPFDGVANPAPPAAANCVARNNGWVVPWQTLSIPRSAAYDAWGRRISYLVFDGPQGFTRGNSTGTIPRGMDMSQCSTNAPTGPGVIDCVPGPPYSTNPQRFMLGTLPAGKGLIVQETLTPPPGTPPGTLNTVANPASGTGAAFVLISHGPSGYGAWTAAGTRFNPLPAGGSYESTNAVNVSPAVPFIVSPFSAATVDPGDINHYDDLVVWMSIRDLAQQAGRYARNWP